MLLTLYTFKSSVSTDASNFPSLGPPLVPLKRITNQNINTQKTTNTYT